MLKIPKTIEYSLLALKFISENSSEMSVSAKEISEKVDIPFDLLAKILQKLNKEGIIKSQQGTRGGYVLNISLEKISLSSLLSALEQKIQLTDCMTEKPTKNDCARVSNCCLRTPIGKIQIKIEELFNNTTITELIK